jgi:hypothetical protein
MSELRVPKVKPEDAHVLALATWGQMCDALVQAFVKKYGKDEALTMLRADLQKLGEPAPLFAQMMGIEGKDALTIASIFCLYEGQILKVEGKVTEASPERVVKQSTQCPFQGLSSGFCLAFTIMAEGMAAAINPEYKLTVTQMMTDGDPICEWIVEKK